jgi:putative membrane protein
MRTLKLFSITIAVCGIFVACNNAGSTADRLADSTSLGDRADSAAAVDKNTAPKNETNESKIDGDGATFMKAAALGSNMEIASGKIAMQNSSNAKVKEFAAKMVADHTMAQSDLIKISQKNGILLPQEFPDEMKTHMEAMSKLKGAEFDHHYMDMMVKDHVKTLDLFKSANTLKDDVLKDFAAKTLPVLETHHKLAVEIQSTLK